MPNQTNEYTTPEGASPSRETNQAPRWTPRRVVGILRRRATFRLTHRGPRRTFQQIHRSNYWADDESVSGEGSSTRQTAVIVRELPTLLRRAGVERLLDLPCGDFAWMSRVDRSGFSYIGGDIVPELIDANQRAHATDCVEFRMLDLTVADLPDVDGILVRDCLVHLSTPLVWAAIERIRRSKIRYLLTTTYPQHHDNRNIPTGRWRALNLEEEPFDFPAPLDSILEECTEHEGTRADKTLALWLVTDLPAPPVRVRLDPRYRLAALRHRLGI